MNNKDKHRYSEGSGEICGLTYDLHSHSTVSDGTLRPAELVKVAAASGVDVLALTDHDNVSGIAEAEATAQEQGIRVIPGVEISVSWNGHTVHILGLQVAPENEVLLQGLQELCEYRQWRAQEIGRKLHKKGISDAYEGACEQATGALVGRLHFARFLVQHGHARDVKDVFRKYLVTGKPGYVCGEWAALEDAMGWILAAGGLAVIAHPARYKMTRGKLRRLIGEFKELGGRGLEVVSGSHSRDEYFTMARHARDFDLLASAGSDYHGPDNPWIKLGNLPELPPGCDPVWKYF